MPPNHPCSWSGSYAYDATLTQLRCGHFHGEAAQWEQFVDVGRDGNINEGGLHDKAGESRHGNTDVVHSRAAQRRGDVPRGIRHDDALSPAEAYSHLCMTSDEYERRWSQPYESCIRQQDEGACGRARVSVLAWLPDLRSGGGRAVRLSAAVTLELASGCMHMTPTFFPLGYLGTIKETKAGQGLRTAHPPQGRVSVCLSTLALCALAPAKVRVARGASWVPRGVGKRPGAGQDASADAGVRTHRWRLVIPAQGARGGASGGGAATTPATALPGACACAASREAACSCMHRGQRTWRLRR